MIGNGYIVCFRFSPDGTKIASLAHDGTVRLWDTINGSTLDTIQTTLGDRGALAFSPDGAYIAIASPRSRSALLWDLINAVSWRTGDIFTKNLQSYDLSIKFSPNGRFLILATTRTLALVDIVTGQVVRPIESSYDDYLPAFRMPFLELYAGLKTNEFPIRMWADVAGELLLPNHSPQQNSSDLQFLVHRSTHPFPLFHRGWVDLACESSQTSLLGSRREPT